MTTLEYMREYPDYMNYMYECGGAITVGDTTIHCFDNTVHGLEDLRSSVANSCNASFANIGLLLDKNAYRKTAENYCLIKNCRLSWIIRKVRLPLRKKPVRQR